MASLRNDDAPAAENYVKGYSKKCQTYKKILRKLVALLESYVTFEKLLLIIPGFRLFMRVGFFLVAPATTDVPRSGKNPTSHVKLHTLKQLLQG